jgi:uncharacterized protein YigE (DUF2233 family)
MHRYNLKLFATLIALLFLTQANAAPEKKVIDGITYQILSAPSSSIKIIWKDDAGKALRTFPEVAQ